MHSGIVNKTRYDDPRKPMKQTSFIVKNLGEKPSQKEIHYSKEKFQIKYKTFVPRLYNPCRRAYSRNLLPHQNL